MTSPVLPRRILVIRRDNIGDLICTTPLLAALRQQWPQAWIGVLANSYNAPILDGNPDIDVVFAYRKAKHRSIGESRWSIWLETAAMLWRLRRKRLDLVLCASPGAGRFARWLGAQRIIETDRAGNMHEVEITCRLLDALDIKAIPSALVVKPDPQQVERLRTDLNLSAHERRIAIHISARKPRQRWPKERFAELIRQLLSNGHTDRILLFWAPGAEDDALHPGDDNKAKRLVDLLPGLPVTPIPTHQLPELIASLSLADAMIWSDGGAMHIAAGLGKPIVCFFGNSSAERWHPWGVPFVRLQKPSENVAEVTVDEAYSAFMDLTQGQGAA